MKAWGPPEPPDDVGASQDAEARAKRERERAERIRAIESAGIDLDPVSAAKRRGRIQLEPGAGRPDDNQDDDDGHAGGEPHDHPHPHAQSAVGDPPVIGIVGAGAVGTALGVALERAGWPIHAVASRDQARRDRFRSLVPGVRPFADVERAVAALHGATIAIEGDDQLLDLLARMAEAVGGRPVRLAPGAKAAYHAAAVLAAGGFVALLDAIVELGRVAGLDEAGSLAVYGPLIEQTLGNARTLGVAAALTGPMTRGDRGTVARHLAVLTEHAPDVVPLYRAAAEREIELALARGALTPEAAAELRSTLVQPLATAT